MSESTPPLPTAPLFIGLMSGTSLDGVDGVVVRFNEDGAMPPQLLAHAHLPFDPELHRELMSLQASGINEIDREAQAANQLVQCYADCVNALLARTGTIASSVRAIGVHGQTIRHRPERGYTRQVNNPALLAELCGIDVIADFRSRDIAAGGQGAPLVPAFHRAAFASADECRVVANIGGIANITVLDPVADTVSGYDTGPGNVLMDLWIARQRNQAFDAGGTWAASGTVIPDLLGRLCRDSYFGKAPPKSTGRDLFHAAWLDNNLADESRLRPEDVQRTLCELTAVTLADAIHRSVPKAGSVFVCGGGAKNEFLLRCLRDALAATGSPASVRTTEAVGVAPDHVESMAFAWLAQRFMARRPGNLPSVTGAVGPRVLGALYPA